ncbi:MAG: DUF4190 domain-containing protein [Patescibacteria group bacterium]
MTEPKQPEANNLAIASLVLGILSLTGMSILTGIPAIITGIMGLKNPINKGMSIAGIIMGGLSVLFALAVLLLFILLLITGAFAASSFENTDDFHDSSSPRDSSLYQQRA